VPKLWRTASNYTNQGKAHKRSAIGSLDLTTLKVLSFFLVLLFLKTRTTKEITGKPPQKYLENSGTHNPWKPVKLFLNLGSQPIHQSRIGRWT
jgi:hypothetical protein